MRDTDYTQYLVFVNCSFQKYEGSFLNMIKKADKSAQKLLELLVEEFTSFRDVAEFEGKKGQWKRSWHSFDFVQTTRMRLMWVITASRH